MCEEKHMELPTFYLNKKKRQLQIFYILAFHITIVRGKIAAICLLDRVNSIPGRLFTFIMQQIFKPEVYIHYKILHHVKNAKTGKHSVKAPWYSYVAI